MIPDVLLEKLQHYLYTDQHPEEYIFWCPVCEPVGTASGAKHAHLYVSKEAGSWFCQRCQRGNPNLESLFRLYGIPLSDADKLEFFRSTSTASLLGQPDNQRIDKASLKMFTTEADPVQEDTAVFRYLKNRQIPEDVILREWATWKRHPGYAFWYHLDKEESVDFYSGRAYMPGVEPKYRHVAGDKPFILFNTDKFAMSPSGSKRYLLFLVEGLFDAILAPGPAIPLWGKTIIKRHRENLIGILRSKNASVVCALDSEEVDANIRLAQFLHEASIPEVFMFDLSPHKDFGEGAFRDFRNFSDRCILFDGYNRELLKLKLKGF